jgi:hypothetical protein
VLYRVALDLHPGRHAVAREHPTRRGIGIDTSTEPPTTASRYGSLRWRSVGYWLATVLVAAELGLGGIWDIARLPMVRDLVTHLGYPSYFLVLLGTWKVLGAVALLVPRRALLKEWAYAGAFFTYTGRSSPTWPPATTSASCRCWPS